MNKRPIESDYTSHVAYTRSLEEYCDWLTQPEQEPVDYKKLAALGWQSIECPFCGSSGAQAFPKPEQEPVEGVVLRDGYPTLTQDKYIRETDERLFKVAIPPQRKPLTDEENCNE